MKTHNFDPGVTKNKEQGLALELSRGEFERAKDLAHSMLVAGTKPLTPYLKDILTQHAYRLNAPSYKYRPGERSFHILIDLLLYTQSIKHGMDIADYRANVFARLNAKNPYAH